MCIRDSYDPESETWKALPREGAPIAARGMQAIWTGTEMIVWSGANLEGDPPLNLGLQTGGRYNPNSNSWQPTATDRAPDGRLYYAAVWTGEEMIVWGGGDQRSGNPVSYTHLRAHETPEHLVCRLLLEKKKNAQS